MSQYLTVEDYQGLTLVPSIVIDQSQALDPAWLNNQLTICSGEIDARLAKRYAVPLKQPSNQVKIWLAKLVDLRVYIHLGVSANDQQIQLIVDNEANAKLEMKEAADCVTGLFDLPLIQDQQGSGIVSPKILSTSDATPYRWIRTQAQRYG